LLWLLAFSRHIIRTVKCCDTPLCEREQWRQQKTATTT
jgi:hypothetical protein